MLSVEWTANGVRATDAAERETTIFGDMTPLSEGPTLDRPVDQVVHASAGRLRFPTGSVVVDSLDTEKTYRLCGDATVLSLPECAYRLSVDGPVLTYLRVNGTLTITRQAHGAVEVESPTQRQVTLGFHSHAGSPREQITVTRTPEGLAKALTAFGDGHQTRSPDRSLPSLREHPPTVTFVDEQSAANQFSRESEIELVVPPELSYLTTAASLVYYLGAAVRTQPGVTPRLEGHTDVEFASGPGFETCIAEQLRQVVHLDSLVRSAGPHGTDVVELDALNHLDIDPDRLYAASMADRLSSYQQTDYEAITDQLPPWNLSMYVQPEYEYVASLPYFLADLPQLHLPRAEPLQGKERLSRSLEDFYRGTHESVAAELQHPDLSSAHWHGWLAQTLPIDVFRSLPAAYRNRARYLERSSEPISVVCVVNDKRMSKEAGNASELYRSRAEELNMRYSHRENVSRAQLKRVFEKTHDLVHFIGHCEPSGLVCRDGTLAASELDVSNAQSFFLNACGSVREGIDLVRNGSVAGGVTVNSVLDESATTVGTDFGRLLIHGFEIERAITLARRQVMAGKDYMVIGDGTHSLMQARDLTTGYQIIDSRDDGRYDVAHRACMLGSSGATWQSQLQSDGRSSLCGSTQTFEISETELMAFLSKGDGDHPIVFDGQLTWRSDLSERLTE